MTWIADPNLPAVATWTAIVLSGLASGVLLSRWRDPAQLSAASIERLLLVVAAAGVVGWCANAGALAANSSSSAMLTAHVPIDTGPGVRLAVLWATLPGAALTLGMLLLIVAAFSVAGAHRARFLGLTCATAFIALGISAWFAPASGDAAVTIPPFVQSTAATIAPLFALFAVFGLAVVSALTLSQRSAPSVPRPALLGTWLAAGAALVSEQLARSQLGIGPRDAVVLGSASSGLILWLVTSALLHRRAQALVFRLPSGSTSVGRSQRATYAARAGHAGALCLAASFAAHAFASRSTISLPPGTPVSVTDSFRRAWSLVNQGVSRYDEEGVDVTALAVEVRLPADRVGLLTPEVRAYHGRNGQHLAAPISLRREIGGAAQAMRVLLMETDSLDVARVRITFLPAPILWPIGVALLGLSAILALSRPPPSTD